MTSDEVTPSLFSFRDHNGNVGFVDIKLLKIQNDGILHLKLDPINDEPIQILIRQCRQLANAIQIRINQAFPDHNVYVMVEIVGGDMVFRDKEDALAYADELQYQALLLKEALEQMESGERIRIRHEIADD